jgi:hypothetical protein
LLAPEAFSVPELPVQIAVDVPAVETVGFGFTTKLTVSLLTQPKAFVPETVNNDVASGVLTNEAVLMPPGFHVNVKAPLALSVELPPGQTDVGVADTVKSGAANVTTVAVALLVHVKLDAITVYTVVTLGVTETVGLFTFTGNHV